MKKILFFCFLSALGFTVYAGQVKTEIYTTEGHHKIGEVTFKDAFDSLLITPNLTGLPPGLHGFHLHAKANCDHDGMDAGGHFDPKKTDHHLGPYGKGHLGDLPVLYVDQEGKAIIPTFAPRLKTSDLKGVAVMIHSGGDNYSDTPKLGGGGPRIACGTIQK